MYNQVKVGMADLNTAVSPNTLITLGLGSCVGIGLYDKEKKIAGLAHIMLPSSKHIKNNQNPAKFADTAIKVLLQKMIELGAKENAIIAKIAGGAQMFSFKNTSNDILNIGERNVIATIDELNNLNIPILAQDTGGNYGRTVELHASTGILNIRTIQNGIKEI